MGIHGRQAKARRECDDHSLWVKPGPPGSASTLLGSLANVSIALSVTAALRAAKMPHGSDGHRFCLTVTL
jgi:hypothetical protein